MVKDRLSPARGCLYGVLLGAAIWVALILVALALVNEPPTTFVPSAKHNAGAGAQPGF